MSESHVDRPAGFTRFEAALQRRASRSHKTVDEIVAADLEEARHPRFPSPDCLSPHEVELFYSGTLDEKRASHVDSCPMCSAVLEISRPAPRGVARFLAEVHNSAHAEAAEASFSGNLVAIASFIAAAASLLLVIAFGWAFLDNTARSFALSELRPQIVGMSILAGSITLCFALFFKHFRRYSISSAAMTVMGSFLVGGIFSIPSVVSVATTSQGISFTTSKGLYFLATDHTLMNGKNTPNRVVYRDPDFSLSMDNNSLIAKAADVSGPLVFKDKDDRITVDWSRRSTFGAYTTRRVGEIYKGVYQRDENGDAHIINTDRKEIKVSTPAIDPEIGNGSPVYVLVPQNQSEAVQVQPIK